MTATKATRLAIDELHWTSAEPIYGPGAVHDGQDVIQLKILSDRRREGGGLAYLAKFQPPPGKKIRIVAVARSDEHSFTLEGGRGTKSGRTLRMPSDYTLNPDGHPHSAFISTNTVSLIVYTGEPDEIRSIDIVEINDDINGPATT